MAEDEWKVCSSWTRTYRVNVSGKKRKFEDEGLGDSFQTPAKKTFKPLMTSPDEGCFVDSFSPRSGEDVEEDKGYVSISSLKDCHVVKDPFKSEDPERPLAVSSPVRQVPEVEHRRTVKLRWDTKQLSEEFSSFPVVSGSLLPSAKSCQPLEGDGEELHRIGLPIMESSLCHNLPAPVNTADDTLSTSYETSLPLEVQVKSVVVVPKHRPPVSAAAAAAAAAPLSLQNSQRTASISTSPIPRQVDSERDKQQYIQAVANHMNQNPGSGPGITGDDTEKPHV
ncbi:uncharacterized protein V6R79_009269 [Siganus canaliculatus]